jgi:acyl-CoA thioesterase-1
MAVGIWKIAGAALIMTAFAQTATQSNAAPKRQVRGTKTVLVLGDSLSEGFGLDPREAWPALVVQRLREIDPKFQIVNASVNGGTSEGGVRRLPSYLMRKIDVFVLELGINDAFRGVPVERMRDNLQSMVDQVKATNPNAAVIIVGMQFPIETSDEYVTAFGKMFAELAEKNRAALVPYLLEGVAGDPSLNLSDRIHPNAAGHRILAKTMWRVLEPVAREVAAR